MGISKDKDVVPFALEAVLLFSDFADDKRNKLCDPESWYEEYSEIPEGDDSVETLSGKLVVDGWTLGDSCGEIGKNNHLFGPLWEKDGHRVWLINQSQYSNGGDFEVAVCAKDEESIKEFTKDMGQLYVKYTEVQPQIEANVAIVQFS